MNVPNLGRLVSAASSGANIKHKTVFLKAEDSTSLIILHGCELIGGNPYHRQPRCRFNEPCITIRMGSIDPACLQKYRLFCCISEDEDYRPFFGGFWSAEYLVMGDGYCYSLYFGVCLPMLWHHEAY